MLNAGAGSIGAIAGIIIGSPLDVIKTQLQAGRAPAGSSAFSLFRSSLASPRAMFKGVGASALSMAPNNFVMFGSYGSAMEALQCSPHSESWSHLARVGAAGSLGGFLQSFVVSPFELVKVQQQTNSEGRPPSALSSVRHIVQQHGPAGLWRGMFLSLHPPSVECAVPHGCYQVSPPSSCVTLPHSALTSWYTKPWWTQLPRRWRGAALTRCLQRRLTHRNGCCGHLNWSVVRLRASRAGRWLCRWTW